jgi:hypothetical protein
MTLLLLAFESFVRGLAAMCAVWPRVVVEAFRLIQYSFATVPRHSNLGLLF